ncbi:MAG TPA: Ig-like domain-containing protein [Chitinophagales bacterium]|nr:Ig-like domain-containing protein [Chitinophagales bacterium]
MRQKFRINLSHIRCVAAFLISSMVISCAQIASPTGGDRDKTPPKAVAFMPPSGTTNFQKKEIKIEFDEWIQPLQNAKNQVIISPSIEPFPNISIARNELSIKWKQALDSNTTYSFFFGDNIKDNNEGNIMPDFKYIFSTGSYIDSLQVKGTVHTTLESVPENSYVLLYKDMEDSAFLQKRPFYISKIQSDGSFQLDHVKEGNYRVYGLSDKNNNYYYDLPTEAIAFSDSILYLSASIDTLSLELFLPEEMNWRIVAYDRVIKGGRLQIEWNKEMSATQDQFSVTLQDTLSPVQPVAFPMKDAKKLMIYFPGMPADTGTYTLYIRNKNQLLDSLQVRAESRRFGAPIPFFTDTMAYKNLRVIEGTPLQLTSVFYSLSPVDTSRILLTDTSGTVLPFSVSRADDWVTYSISADWKGEQMYKLVLLDSALSDLTGNYAKKQEFSFSAVSRKKCGKLLITYQLPEKNTQYIAILKDNSGKALHRHILRDSQAVQIDYGWLPAGMFTVEAVEDLNENGRWNSGNFALKTLPEKIYKVTKPIILKENWDAEETIPLDFSVPVHSSPLSPSSKVPATDVSGILTPGNKSKPGGNK